MAIDPNRFGQSLQTIEDGLCELTVDGLGDCFPEGEERLGRICIKLFFDGEERGKVAVVKSLEVHLNQARQAIRNGEVFFLTQGDCKISH